MKQKVVKDMTNTFSMYFVLIVGGLYDVVLLFLFLKRIRFRRNSLKVKGKIIEYQSNGRYSYPIIVFSTIKNKQIQIIGHVPRIGGKGKNITVYYDPLNPLKTSYDLGVLEFVLYISFFLFAFVWTIPFIT
jgi:hypothetical protein